MPNPIPARITDYLQKLALFSKSPAAAGTTLAAGEEIYGVYRNNLDVPTRGILLTSNGIHVQFVGHAQFVAYNEIREMTWFTWERKELERPENRRLVVELNSGERLEIYVVGARGIGLDLSNFHNFLLGAVQVRNLEARRVIKK
jgi:hypothetical protein